jgi:hypothetical protein
MNFSIKYILLPLTFAITSCATIEVTKQDTNDDDYYLEATVNLGGSIAIVEYNALVAAKDYCKKLSKDVLVQDISSYYIPRSTWKSRLKFYCLSSSDPRLDEDVYKNEGIYFKIK